MGFSKDDADKLQARVFELRDPVKRSVFSVDAAGHVIPPQPGQSARHFIATIEPMGAPRQTRRDAWKPRECVVRYRAWKDQFRAICAANDWTLRGVLHAEFHLSMPASWSKKRRAKMLGSAHEQKPDIDNLCKAVMDAFNTDDSHVHTLNVKKVWSEVGRIVLYY